MSAIELKAEIKRTSRGVGEDWRRNMKARSALERRVRADREAALTAKLEAIPIPDDVMRQARADVRGRQNYGRRNIAPEKKSWRLSWSNGSRDWWVHADPVLRGKTVNLDANEILVASPLKRVAEAVAHRLTKGDPHPLAALSTESVEKAMASKSDATNFIERMRGEKVLDETATNLGEVDARTEGQKSRDDAARQTRARRAKPRLDAVDKFARNAAKARRDAAYRESQIPANAKFKIREESDGTFTAVWDHPTKPLMGEQRGLTRAKAEAQIEQWKAEAGAQNLGNVSPKKSGEGGFLNLSEIAEVAKRIEKVWEGRAGYGRIPHHEYIYRDPKTDRVLNIQVWELGGGKSLQIEAWPQVRDPAKDAEYDVISKDPKDAMQLGARTMTAIRDWLMSQHPEAENVFWQREGTTGFRKGRAVAIKLGKFEDRVAAAKKREAGPKITTSDILRTGHSSELNIDPRDYPASARYRSPVTGLELPQGARVTNAESRHAGYNIQSGSRLYSRYDPESGVVYVSENLNALMDATRGSEPMNRGGFTMSNTPNTLPVNRKELFSEMRGHAGELIGAMGKVIRNTGAVAREWRPLLLDDLRVYSRNLNRAIEDSYALGLPNVGARHTVIYDHTTARDVLHVNAHESIHSVDPNVSEIAPLGPRFQELQKSVERFNSWEDFGVQPGDTTSLAMETLAYGLTGDIHPNFRKMYVGAIADIIEAIDKHHGDEPIRALARRVTTHGKEILEEILRGRAQGRTSTSSAEVRGSQETGRGAREADTALTPEGKISARRPRTKEGGYIDLAEIRDGLAQGKLKRDEAMERLRRKFPSRGDDQLRALLNRKSDPLIGYVDDGRVESTPDLFRNAEHYIAFGDQIFGDQVAKRPGDYRERWRYEPADRNVYWTVGNRREVSTESRQAVEAYLFNKDLSVRGHRALWEYNAKEMAKIEADNARPRSREAGFVDLSEIKAGIKKLFDETLKSGRREVGYELNFRNKEPVQFRANIDKEGNATLIVGKPPLEDASEDYAYDRIPTRTSLGTDTILAVKNYLLSLHPEIKSISFTRVGSTGGEFGRGVDLSVKPRSPRAEPTRITSIEELRAIATAADTPADVQRRAQRLLGQMKLTPREKVYHWNNTYKGGQRGAINLTEVRAGMRDALREVRRRMDETGPLMAFASGTYDITKYPKGGKPDYQKLAYWLEPAIYKMWEDSNRRFAEKKLRGVPDTAAGMKAYVRKEFAKLLTTHFNDWHPINRRAALVYAVKYIEELGGPDEAAKAEKPRVRNLETERAQLKKRQQQWQSLEDLPADELVALAAQKYPETYRKAIDTGNPEAVIDRLYRDILPKNEAKKKTAATWQEEVMNRLNAHETELDRLEAAQAEAGPSPAEQVAALGGTTPPKPPPAEAPTTSEFPGGPKERGLWRSLEDSGRVAGTQSSYDPETKAGWKSAATHIIDQFGTAGAEEYYRRAKHGGIRTAVGNALGDRYQLDALAAGDTPASGALWEKAIRFADERVTEATELGRAVKAYDDFDEKLESPAGALDTAIGLYRQIVRNPVARIPKQVASVITEAAGRAKKAAAKVTKLEAQVAAEPEGVKPAPRKVKVIKKPKAPTPPTEPGVPPTIFGAGLGGFQAKFERPVEPPQVRAARLRERALNKAFNAMEKSVGKFWTKASHPALERARIERDLAKLEVAKLLRALEQRNMGTLRRAYGLTSSLMVSAFPTASRNAQSQALRSGLERLTDAAEIMLRHGGARLGLTTKSDMLGSAVWRNYVRTFHLGIGARLGRPGAKPGAWTYAENVLRAHPGEFLRMYTLFAGGANIPFPNPFARGIDAIFGKAEKFAYVANTFNRVQEFHIRSAEFLSELEIHTKKATGLTLEQFIARRGADKLPKDLIKQAVNKALDVTFAANPPTDTRGGKALAALIKFGDSLPVPPTSRPVVFPKFMYNSLKFLTQYNPITGLANVGYGTYKNARVRGKLRAVDALGTSITPKERDAAISAILAQQKNVPRAIAQQLLGTAMFAFAYQIRKDNGPDGVAGGKWYEIKVGDRTYDTRPFGPFSTYLLMAEALRRHNNGERGFTKTEWLEGLGASTAPGGLSMATAERFFNYYESGDYDKIGNVLATEVGDWARALLTPIRQAKAIASFFDASERVMKDTKEHPITGPIRESLPYASRSLPEAHRATSGAPIHTENPAEAFFSGYRRETPKNFLEREADRMHFRPNEIRAYTGNQKLDTAITRYMGPLVDKYALQLEGDPRYRKSSEAVKFAAARNAFRAARHGALAQAAREFPKEFIEYKTREPYWRQQLLDERKRATPEASPAPSP
jgi:hypothetical protein